MIPPSYRIVFHQRHAIPRSPPLRFLFRVAEQNTSFPGDTAADIGARKKRRNMEGGKEQVGGEQTFLFRRKFNMSDMTAGGRYVGEREREREREERAIVRGRLRP